MSKLASITNSVLNMTVSDMYNITQNLYEGVKYKLSKEEEEKISGVITYMRTSSQNISQEFKEKIRLHIKKIFGLGVYEDNHINNMNINTNEAP